MISVVMATFNGEKYVLDQLSSILAQISESDEVVIVDDNSQDDTVAMIKKVGDPRVQLIENNRNVGPVEAFHTGMQAAIGDFIFLSDQDDVWLSNKVDLVRQKLLEYDLVCHDCYVSNESLEITSTSFFKDRNSKSGILRNLMRNTYVGCCMAFRREVFISCQKFLKYAPMHDVWIGLSAELNGFKVEFLDAKLINYRRHDNTETLTAKGVEFKPSFNQLNSRAKLIFYLLLLAIRKRVKA